MPREHDPRDITYRCPMTGELAFSGMRGAIADTVTVNLTRGNCESCGGEHVLNQPDLRQGWGDDDAEGGA